MSFEIVNRNFFAREMGIDLDKEIIGNRDVASLLRLPIARWGLVQRRVLVRYTRKQVDVLGLVDPDSEAIGKVLDQMLAIGECQEVRVRGERYIAPGLPRWLSTGDKTGVMLGSVNIPSELKRLKSNSQDDIVIRISVTSDDDHAALLAASIKNCTMTDYLGPLEYLKHASRRIGKPVRDDLMSLEDFWEILVTTLAHEGRPIGDDSDIRILSGTPGSFFGRSNAPKCEGRWTEDSSDGIWCAYRRGYNSQHWYPVIIHIIGNERVILDLYDNDEWKWSLLARGKATGQPEQYKRIGKTIKITSLLPKQILSGLDLLGPRRSDAWTWEINESAPNILESILQISN